MSEMLKSVFVILSLFIIFQIYIPSGLWWLCCNTDGIEPVGKPKPPQHSEDREAATGPVLAAK